MERTRIGNFSVETLGARISLAEYIPSCVDVEKFSVCCRECENYDRRWSCPPFAFDPVRLWRDYTTLDLLALRLCPAVGTAYPELSPALSAAKSALFRHLLALEREHPGSLALSPGTCDLCEKCAKTEGKPCVLPKKLRYSIESLGGDVEKTCRMYLNTEICWAKPPNLPKQILLVGGLLLP